MRPQSSVWGMACAAGLVLVIAASTFGADPPPKPTESRKLQRLAPITIQASVDEARKTTAEFREPDESAFKDFHQLRLTTGTFESENAPVGVPGRFELVCYNGRPVGPTIRVRRGTTFHIGVVNDLNGNDAGQHPAGSGTNEKPFDLCTTNLHTHGLHVSPGVNADNIFVELGPKKTSPKNEFTFEYTIAPDHPTGTFWYHPHKHGSVAYQLSNGVAGALIVEGAPRDGTPKLEDVPEIAAARERILVFQLYNYRLDKDPAGGKPIARIDASTIYNVQPDSKSCSAIAIPASDPIEDPKQATAINGVINPIIRLAPGEVQRWRLIHAGWDIDRFLTIFDDQGTPHPAEDFKFHEIAVDGLATGTMVMKSNDPDDTTGRALEIAPGQRSDVLLRAPLLKPGEKERVYHLVQTPTDAGARYLAKIVVTGPPRRMRLPDLAALVRCQPFASIRDEELSKPSFPGTPSMAFFASDTKQTYTINQKTFMNQSTVQIRLDTAEEWTIRSDGSNHPFHIHVNPFQVVMKTDANGKSTPMNLWRDTLYIKEKETYTIRSRFRDFLGQTVLHCHILDHEDQGMMIPIEFIPPYQTPAVTPPAGNKLKPANGPAPALKLRDPAGGIHALTDFRRHNVVLIFFQGAECNHCTAALRDLVREVRGPLGVDAEVVAVSSRPIPDAAATAKTLGVTAADNFILLVDAEHTGFRDFGCFDRGPQHGLFLIDRAGSVRARYVGATPFADAKAAIERVRQLDAPSQLLSR
jgi:FtsP/CotA-like multicopper oxidase with cupredoxin domain/peroxiredoxin